VIGIGFGFVLGGVGKATKAVINDFAVCDRLEAKMSTMR